MGKLALVLSGGGARGAFQAGALMELLSYFESEHKRINILSGTSVGALNGMSIAQAASLNDARKEIELQWKQLTSKDVYKVRGWELLKLVAKFSFRRMEQWPSIRGANSIFDTTPLYRKFVDGYLDMARIRSRRTVDEFYVSLSSLNTGESYLQCVTREQSEQKAKEYIMASTITTVAYPPVRTIIEDSEIPAHLALIPQLYADGGISNKTPFKTILRAGDISELYVVNTYPLYPNKTEHSIKALFPNVFSMLIRTAVELLPNLYFVRDMQSVKEVNSDLRAWDNLKKKILGGVPDRSTREKVEEILRVEEQRFSFKEGNKHIIDPVIIAPDEELPIQDTDFVQPKLMETFEMGREKARSVLGSLRRTSDDRSMETRVSTMSAS